MEEELLTLPEHLRPPPDFTGVVLLDLFFFCVALHRLWLGLFMVFSATLNNISVVSWRSVLLVEETGVPGENNRPVASY